MDNSNSYLPAPKSFFTTAIHFGQNPEQWESLSVVAPIYTSAVYKWPEGVRQKYMYGRAGSPSRDILEGCLAKLENGNYGLCFSSGVAAIAAVLNLFKNGDHVILCEGIYHGTDIVFENASSSGVTTSTVDATDIKNVEKAITPNTKLIWIESITNPLLNVIDIKALSALAKKHQILLVVDNTFLTPYFQNPLTLGADIVVHSLSKYINGHTDVIMGAILLNDDKLYERLRYTQIFLGSVPSPFDCYQVSRSLKTLGLRMKQHSENALMVAKFLENHPKVAKVIHPGLPSHPQHELFKKQTSGHSGMIAVYLKGDLKDAKKFMGSLKLFVNAVSLGGCESLIEIPFIMTQGRVSRDKLKKLNITDNLLRMSVGIEDTEDLIEDLRQALDAL